MNETHAAIRPADFAEWLNDKPPGFAEAVLAHPPGWYELPSGEQVVLLGFWEDESGAITRGEVLVCEERMSPTGHLEGDIPLDALTPLPEGAVLAESLVVFSRWVDSDEAAQLCEEDR